MGRRCIVALVLLLLLLHPAWVALKAAGPAAFLNFETAPVHPVALGPDGRTLAVCNLPDYRVELFDVSSGVPQRVGEVRVGVDPVSLRWRTTNELWVVNHISGSVSVVDVPRRLIVATLTTRSGPADVVFAGNPSRAYVSCSRENLVQVFDPISRQSVTNLPIQGERPKAMGVSPDGSQVYVAVFESGNASTILAPRLTTLDVVPPPSVVADPEGPYGGQDPPPNHGAGFVPPLAPYLDSNTVSRGSLIVKKNAGGRWMDDNHGDWTEFVSGSKAARSGRIPGWDMPDRDLAVIDTVTHGVTYATGLMNLCMALAVNPASGVIAVAGTDGLNEVRFEPNLRGVFLRVNVALVTPGTLTRTVRDLNPHLDYTVANLPAVERAKSIGDPRGIVWNSAGTRAYVTGMGSGNLVVLDADGRRVQQAAVELGEGPTGLALDEPRGRLYVLNRFSASVSAVDLTSMAVVTNTPFHDPTPAFIKAGRRHFYDTRRTSGLGYVSCASCHPDGRVDRLAWDLGIPNGEMFNLPGAVVTNYFHPMKGPMVTRTLQDPMPKNQGKALLHWRGDRATVGDFHLTFPDLLAADKAPSVTEMRELANFLSAIAFPPNRFRTLDNRLPESLPLPGFAGLSTDGGPAPPLPAGNAVRGFELFKKAADPGQTQLAEIRRNSCSACHDCESGKGVEIFRVLAPRSDGFSFMGAPLRGLDDKLGFDLQSAESRAGFGFLHDGRTDTLTRFLVDGFEFQDNQDIADMTAFLLSFSGGEMPDCGNDDPHTVPDGPAATGRQVTLTSPEPTPELLELLAATQRAGQVANYLRGELKPSEFVVTGRQAGVTRSWWRDVAGQFVSDRNGEAAGDVFSLAGPDSPLTFTAVPYGTGRRLAIDRDDDGVYDRTEAEQGSDPLDQRSPSAIPPPEDEDFYAEFHAVGYPGQRLDYVLDSGVRMRNSVPGPLHPNNRVSFEFMNPSQAPAEAELRDGGTRLFWDVPASRAPGYWWIDLRALDNARATPGYAWLVIAILPPNPLAVVINPYPANKPHREDTELLWDPVIAHTRYEVHTADSPLGPWKISASIHTSRWWDRSPALGRTNRFYRVLGLPD